MLQAEKNAQLGLGTSTHVNATNDDEKPTLEPTLNRTVGYAVGGFDMHTELSHSKPLSQNPP